LVDPAWAGLSKEKMIAELRASKHKHVVAALGEHWSAEYMQSYIDFVEHGGNLKIIPFISQKLIEDLVKISPIHIAVASSVLNGKGRHDTIGLRKTRDNPVGGKLTTHSVVVHGDDGDTFLVADPWKGQGKVNKEQFVAAANAAITDGDNLLFQIKPKS